LDHAEGRLKAAVLGHGNIKKIAPVNVQLIPSAGMSIQNNRVGTKAQGILFNVDGFRPLAINTPKAAVAVQIASKSGAILGVTPMTSEVLKNYPLSGTDELVISNPLKLY
jgi:hypothetical protein